MLPSLVSAFLQEAITGTSALLVLMLQCFRMLLGSHGERARFAGGRKDDAKEGKNSENSFVR